MDRITKRKARSAVKTQPVAKPQDLGEQVESDLRETNSLAWIFSPSRFWQEDAERPEGNVLHNELSGVK